MQHICYAQELLRCVTLRAWSAILSPGFIVVFRH